MAELIRDRKVRFYPKPGRCGAILSDGQFYRIH